MRSLAATATRPCSEHFFDEPRYTYGTYFFDLQRPPEFLEGTGRLETYASTSRNFYGARGAEISWVAAGLLPELQTHAELWSRTVPTKLIAEPRVAIVDSLPTSTTEREALFTKLPTANGDEVFLLSDPRDLHLLVRSSKPELAVTFQTAGPVSGVAHVGKFTFKKDGA